MSSANAPNRLTSWLRERRRTRTDAAAYWTEQLRRYDALCARLDAEDGAWYHEDFYESLPARRGDDVTIGELTEHGLRWVVSWIPRTSEVVATPTRWIDPDDHLLLATGEGGPPVMEGAAGLGSAVTPAPMPPVVILLGRTADVDTSRATVAEAHDLGDVRAVLD